MTVETTPRRYCIRRDWPRGLAERVKAKAVHRRVLREKAKLREGVWA